MSIIYKHRIENDPLPTGEHMGELTDEYPEHQIEEFVSGDYLLNFYYFKVGVNNMV